MIVDKSWKELFEYCKLNLMKGVETLEEFYQRKFDWLPEEIRKDIGHFNMFHLAPFREGQATSIPYRRRDFYKIMLVKGNSRVHFGDKVVEVQKQALAFMKCINLVVITFLNFPMNKLKKSPMSFQGWKRSLIRDISTSLISYAT